MIEVYGGIAVVAAILYAVVLYMNKRKHKNDGSNTGGQLPPDEGKSRHLK